MTITRWETSTTRYGEFKTTQSKEQISGITVPKAKGDPEDISLFSSKLYYVGDNKMTYKFEILETFDGTLTIDDKTIKEVFGDSAPVNLVSNKEILIEDYDTSNKLAIAIGMSKLIDMLAETAEGYIEDINTNPYKG